MNSIENGALEAPRGRVRGQKASRVEPFPRTHGGSGSLGGHGGSGSFGGHGESRDYGGHGGTTSEAVAPAPAPAPVSTAIPQSRG